MPMDFAHSKIESPMDIMLSCYSVVLPFFIVACVSPLFSKKKGRRKIFSPTFKIASDIPKKSIPKNILENKMKSYTHWMMLRTMTPVVQLFGDFHAAKLEISAVISCSLYQISPIWCVIVSLSLKPAI